ncbi:hypothetical protein FZ942_32550 [Azospirillum lipoferum]|uniref:Uncharacterized protein n=1 Tax=Azospirillum lipoferum TaxID=193 RepID=A0A5A9G6W9_AZOLI|nr:hypothetical protein FZ942_32550 [Azospirillum lipoferum]
MNRATQPAFKIRTAEPPFQLTFTLRCNTRPASGKGRDYAATAKKSAHRIIELRHFRKHRRRPRKTACIQH